MDDILFFDQGTSLLYQAISLSFCHNIIVYYDEIVLTGKITIL